MGSIGGCWGWSAAYEGVVRVDEGAYGTGEMGVRAVLRGAFRERSEARVRVALGYVQKRFSSCLYASVPEESEEGLRNLTERLTWVLTTRLTHHLTAGLTE
ncbi:Uncharacterised protein [Mycobacteroides abscessus subsp. abscessus]|nr:Uncharacterised protein [Mycobacteroides abscessus subsp. abscessus]SIE51271.1 Uncharacterised protein [Mycobacteroides abscessus subsp. abscessus]